MNKIILFISVAFISFNASAQKEYKAMMNDNSINFYDVCKSADEYFETHEKGKGSGFKPYQRWKNANEYKYYPSGDRSNIDPFFAENAFKAFKSKGAVTDKDLFGNGWNELGPFRIDSVSGAYSTGLGRVEDHYVDPTNPNKMYLGSRSGGFWKTIDGGANWQGGSTDFLMASGVNTITVSPTNSDSILINIRNARNGNSHGLYRSIDGGNTWNVSNFNPTNIGFGGLGSNFKIYEVRYHPRVPNLIFIGTSKGIYRSDDNLATWTLLLTSGDIEEIQFHPTNNNIIYLYDSYYWGANHDYVMRSVDQGLSYSQSSQIVANAGNRSVHLSVSTDCANCLYFASDNGVWKSIDDGMNFTFLSNPNQGCGGFAVNDLDTTKMIYGYLDVVASTNGGFNFNQVTSWSLGNTNGAGSGHQISFNTSTDYVHADLHPAKCVNGVFYIGTDGLFCRSLDNGVTWENLSQGVAIRENYKLGVSQSNHFRSISGSQDNGTSIKHQNTWIEFYGADGMEGLIHPLNDDWMIGSLQSGGRRRTKDGGITQGGVTPPSSPGAAWEAPIAYDPNNQMTVYDFRKGVFKSDDFGSSWDSIGAPITFIGAIGSAEIAQNNSNIIVVSSGSKIEKSIDGGVSFIDIKGTLPGSSIQDIAFDPKDDNTIIVVYASYQNNGEKVYKTTDGGTTWTNITHNLGDMPIRSVVIDHLDASNIYLGGEIGVYTMPMNATAWVLYNPNLPNTTIEELEIVNGSNTIKVATWGRGLWEYSLVGRNSYPAIVTTKITDQPTEAVPQFGVDQYVTSTISYDNTLSSVYVEWSANMPAFGNVITMSNTVDSTWVSDTALPNQGVGTKMFFKVFAVGSTGDTSETYKFMYTVQQNCVASGTTSFQGNINLVKFNAINKATGKTAPYSDYYATDSTAVVKGQSYDLSVRLNTDNGNFTYFSTAWIDWNNDGDFLDPNETYQLGSVQNDSNALTSLSPLSISVPVNAFIGKVRMRVVCLYNQVQTNPCANGFDGEVEDYGLIIQPTEGGINLVSFNTINNATGKPALYTDYYTTDTTAIEIGEQYNLLVKLTTNNGNNTYYSTAWFDWNNDGDFADPNETYQLGSVQNDSNALTSFSPLSITVPAGSYLGKIRMRVASLYNQIQIDPNATGYDGEMEDYGLIIDTIPNTTSIQEIESSVIDIFPNPASNNFTIKLNEEFSIVSLELLNTVGQNIVSKTIKNTDVIKVNLENVASGVYFLKIYLNGTKSVHKIIKK